MAEILDGCSLVVVRVPIVVSDVVDFESRLGAIIVFSCSSSVAMRPSRAASFVAERWFLFGLPLTDLLV